MNRAAIVMLRHPLSGKYLVVWNKRYGGFGFPGGKVEDGERPEAAARRELREETTVEALDVAGSMVQVFEGEHGLPVQSTRGSIVHAFACAFYKNAPQESEPGCPVTWWTRDEILQWSPFASFYRRVFAAMGVVPGCTCGCHSPATSDFVGGYPGEDGDCCPCPRAL